MANMPSIGRFIDNYNDVKHKARYRGMNNGEPIYSDDYELPSLRYMCTVKLHGTFAGVKYIKETDEIQALSKGNIITPKDDNAGFAKFVAKNEALFLGALRQLAHGYDSITLTGEWAGPGIQKGVGINLISEKTFFMFGIRGEKDGEFSWFEHPELFLESIMKQPTAEFVNLRSIFEFPHWTIKIDFANPNLDPILKLTEDIDAQCPVAESFGHKGHGEGLVCTAFWEGQHFVFKSKGESHAKVKKKKIKAKDPKEAEKIALAQKVTPGWRLEQAAQEVLDLNNGGTYDIKKMGDVIKWVINDIIKEEHLDDFQIKDIQKFVSVIVRDWYKKEVNEIR